MYSTPDKVNVRMSSIAIKNEQALLAAAYRVQASKCIALQPLCCKLVGGEALIATMSKYCSLVCIVIVCIEPATVLVFASVNDDRWRNASRALEFTSSLDPDWTA